MDGIRELRERVAAWAETREDVRAALVVGSQARADHPADELSDLDVVLLVRDPELLLGASDWLAEIGTPWITFVEGTAVGGERERRVLFEGGLDVDFVVLPAQALARPEALPPAATGVLRDGYRVLVDKDAELARIGSAARPSATEPFPPAAPEELEAAASDFWYHAVWTAKKLRRGELWVAKECCDVHMKRPLLGAIRLHARVVGGRRVWHRARFLEEWADPRAVAALRDAYARYDREDVARALLATMDLYRLLTTEIADRLRHPYPRTPDERATALVADLLHRT